jgi:hypothetical protein
MAHRLSQDLVRWPMDRTSRTCLTLVVVILHAAILRLMTCSPMISRAHTSRPYRHLCAPAWKRRRPTDRSLEPTLPEQSVVFAPFSKSAAALVVGSVVACSTNPPRIPWWGYAGQRSSSTRPPSAGRPCSRFHRATMTHRVAELEAGPLGDCGISDRLV